MFVRQVRAFTYVELLVVVAITAIMVSIIFPVLTEAKERGCQASCITNIRQIALAVLQYAQDHNDTLIKESENSWALQLKTYNESRVYNCPTHAGVATNSRPDYGYNAALFDVGLGAVTSSVDTILITDLNVGTASRNYAINDPDLDIDARHNNGAIIAFVDGHASCVKLTGPDTYQRLMSLGYTFTHNGNPLPWKVVATGRGMLIDLSNRGKEGALIIHGENRSLTSCPRYASHWDITAFDCAQTDTDDGWRVSEDDACTAQLIFHDGKRITGAAWNAREGVNEYSLTLTLPDTDRGSHQVTFWTPWYHPTAAPCDITFTVTGSRGQTVSYTLSDLLSTHGGYATLSFSGSVTISIATTPPRDEISALAFGALLFD